jgi:hypothetical protein
MTLLGILEAMGTLESRKVSRYKNGDVLISTVRNTDNDEFPYETAIAHPHYNEGKWIIVEEYRDIDEAKTRHEYWVTLMTSDQLPPSLTDISTSRIQQLIVALGGEAKERFEVTP